MEYTVSVVRGKICVKMANALTRYDMMSSFECFNLMNPFSGVGVRTNQYFEPQVMDASNYESISYDLTMNNRRDKQFDIKSSHIYFNSRRIFKFNIYSTPFIPYCSIYIY